MKTATLILAASISICCVSCSGNGSTDPRTPVDYVSTLVGTMSKVSLSTGNTYPAIAMPWGEHFWTPQTGRMGDGWAYVYTEDRIRGFKQTHQPSPWINDYGCFSIMPATTSPDPDEDARASWFSHKAEKATPYYYSVYLGEHDTSVELSPTERSAAFRITYPEKEMSYLIIDAYQGSARVEGKSITGYVTNNHGGVSDNFANYFVIESDTEFQYVEADGGRYAVVGFPTSRGQQVCLKVSSSFISPAQALENIKELGDGDIDRIAGEGRKRWNEVLGRIEIPSGDIDRLRTFYSCLYRSVLFPRDLSEITSDGRRVHYSPHDGKVHDGYLFTDTGLWDTFRSLFSLLYLVYPDQAAKVLEGYQHHYEESGFLPEWASPGHRNCMVGNNSASIVAEAFLKGIGGADYEVLYEALEHDAHAWLEGTTSGRIGYAYYDSLGYIPCNVGINESAARTLEYAYDDWCIARMGSELGKDVSAYDKSCGNWKNLYRAEYGLMSGRNEDGSFPEQFSPYKWGGDFTEGNAWHYTWSVFHDIPSLIETMGGAEAFENTLDKVFEVPPIYDDSYYGVTIHEIREMQIMNMGNYAHGNQPVQHMIYLYNWCGRHDKTVRRVREVMDRFYNAAPDGYCGDEDNGQTSAWYVFSALGFYPVCPASCTYATGAPLFDKAILHLPSGKNLTIKPSSPIFRSDFVSHTDLVN